MLDSTDPNYINLIDGIQNTYNEAVYANVSAALLQGLPPQANPQARNVLLEILAAVQKIQPGTVAVDNTAVLAAIADLKAHPSVVSDPALQAAVDTIAGHFTGK